MQGRAASRLFVSVFLAAIFGAVGCSRDEAYAPGLGEIMTLTQMRHAKLWFAGEAGNWALASYELDELKEGFADAVKYHPTRRGAAVAVSDALPKLTQRPLAGLADAIEQKDLRLFTATYDSLTNACNACHREMQFGFNVVKRPLANPYPNQTFAPVLDYPRAAAAG